MAQDTIDLLKVMVVALVIMALSTLALFYLADFVRAYGSDVPVLGDLPDYEPPAIVPTLVDVRGFVVLGSVYLVASGLTLAAWSASLDMALLVLAKSVSVIISGFFGIFAGTWAFLRLSENTDLALVSLNRLGIALLAFTLFATLLRTANLRSLGALRFLVAAGLVVLGPICLLTL